MTSSGYRPWFEPDWPTPENVGSCITLRSPGDSLPPYDGFNLATHVNDDLVQVEKNRRFLTEELGIISEPFWLHQTHGNCVSVWGGDSNCDASYSLSSQQVCVVMTADCLPLLLCDVAGTQVAAIHAGWRGIHSGIIENTLRFFQRPTEELMVYLGPCLSMDCFEIGGDVYRLLLSGLEAISSKVNSKGAAVCFRASNNPDHYFADLHAMAKTRLAAQGVRNVYSHHQCTFTDVEKFYSYRRDGKGTGRMASMIWLK